MGKPLSLAWVVLFKHLSVIVCLFGGWGVVREGHGCRLHLIVINLQKLKADQILWSQFLPNITDIILDKKCILHLQSKSKFIAIPFIIDCTNFNSEIQHIHLARFFSISLKISVDTIITQLF